MSIKPVCGRCGNEAHNKVQGIWGLNIDYSCSSCLGRYNTYGYKDLGPINPISVVTSVGGTIIGIPANTPKMKTCDDCNIRPAMFFAQRPQMSLNIYEICDYCEQLYVSSGWITNKIHGGIHAVPVGTITYLPNVDDIEYKKESPEVFCECGNSDKPKYTQQHSSWCAVYKKEF